MFQQNGLPTQFWTSLPKVDERKFMICNKNLIVAPYFTICLGVLPPLIKSSQLSQQLCAVNWIYSWSIPHKLLMKRWVIIRKKILVVQLLHEIFITICICMKISQLCANGFCLLFLNCFWWVLNQLFIILLFMIFFCYTCNDKKQMSYKVIFGIPIKL